MTKDPLAGSPWSSPETVSGFVQSAPNPHLLHYAAAQRRAGGRVLLDIGCGAGRNAVPLASEGWTALGTDLSWPMLMAARTRAEAEGVSARVQLALAPMEALPVQNASVDLVVAHGIWNLAASAAQFRAAVAEASRIARPGAGLFVFTFSRNTLRPEALPIEGEAFVFTDFSGQPQCFLTVEQLLDEMLQAGFSPDPALPLTELNLPRPGQVRTGGPVIFQAGFIR